MKNSTIIEKAAMTLADLASGGLMNTQQFNTFYRMVQDEPTIIKDARNVAMQSDSMKIEKIGFGSRILRPGVEATPLADNQRARPTTDKVELAAKEVIAEVNISYDTLENNIEGNNLQNTIMQMISQRAALDIEELILNGDTASSDTYLKLIDGIMKQATSHVSNNASAAIAKEMFKKAQKLVPSKYIRDPLAWRYYLSNNATLEWKDAIASRQTNLGDTALQGGMSTAYGIPVQGIAMLQPFSDGGSPAKQVTNGLLIHPKNIVLGFSRNVRVEVDKDIRARTFIIVLTAKLDVQLEEEDAVAKITNILD